MYTCVYVCTYIRNIYLHVCNYTHKFPSPLLFPVTALGMPLWIETSPSPGKSPHLRAVTAAKLSLCLPDCLTAVGTTCNFSLGMLPGLNANEGRQTQRAALTPQGSPSRIRSFFVRRLSQRVRALALARLCGVESSPLLPAPLRFSSDSCPRWGARVSAWGQERRLFALSRLFGRHVSLFFLPLVFCLRPNWP